MNQYNAFPNQWGNPCGIPADELLTLADERRIREALVKLRDQRLEVLRLAVQAPDADVIATAYRMEEFLNREKSNG